VLEALHAQADLAGELDEAAFVAEMDTRIRAALPPDDAVSLLHATPLDQLHMGLDRWRRKRAEAGENATL
jgi:hypothetical protein